MHALKRLALVVTAWMVPVLALAQPAPMHPELARLISKAQNHAELPPLKAFYSHRGLFHRSTLRSSIRLDPTPENSIDAVNRADSFGVGAVEIDVRLSADNVPMVIHDFVTNRSTILDNDGGKLNIEAYKISMAQPPAPILVSSRTAKELAGIQLKAYGSNSLISTPGPVLHTLEQFLHVLPTQGPLIILDLQNPQTIAAAAAVIHKLGFENRVLLKFFASSAVPDDLGKMLPEAGAKMTIDRWGRGLWYAIQFNSGEIKDDPRFARGAIYKFGYAMGPSRYADAFVQTGRVIAIGVSKPLNDQQLYAAAAVDDIVSYFKDPARRIPRFGILVNPDSAWRFPNGYCVYYSFAANAVNGVLTTNDFDYNMHSQRRSFAYAQNYVIADLLGDSPKLPDGQIIKAVNPGETSFKETLCN